jgi:hypothetical protein
VLGKAAKNVSAENAMEYVLGYTAANDVSSRSSQFAQSQWSFSKGFDGACPIGKHTICLNMVQINNSAAGPTLVSPALIRMPVPCGYVVSGMEKCYKIVEQSEAMKPTSDDGLTDVPEVISFLAFLRSSASYRKVRRCQPAQSF